MQVRRLTTQTGQQRVRNLYNGSNYSVMRYSNGTIGLRFTDSNGEDVQIDLDKSDLLKINDLEIKYY